MSDLLFGSEKSGTPTETREGTEATGRQLQGSVERGDFDPFSRSRMEAVMSILGFNPGDIGLQDAASRSLEDPRDRTSGLFAALEPFEMRTTDRAVEDLRSGFSAIGGRFSRNAREAELDERTRLAEGFARTREESLLTAQSQQTQALATLFSAILGGGQLGQQGVDALLRFFQPGAPNFQEGIAGDIIGAGGTVAGALL